MYLILKSSSCAARAVRLSFPFSVGSFSFNAADTAFGRFTAASPTARVALGSGERARLRWLVLMPPRALLVIVIVGDFDATAACKMGMSTRG